MIRGGKLLIFPFMIAVAVLNEDGYTLFLNKGSGLNIYNDWVVVGHVYTATI